MNKNLKDILCGIMMLIIGLFIFSTLLSPGNGKRESVQNLFYRASDSVRTNTEKANEILNRGVNVFNIDSIKKYSGKATAWYEIETIMYDSLKNMK